MFDRRIATKAIMCLGKEKQKAKAIEEMRELIVELSREHFNRTNAEHITEEIADVMIMMSQLALIYGEDEVGQWVEMKYKRLEKRLEECK